MSQSALKPTPHTMTDETNVIRFLALDAVEKAACGHPGMPMGMAEIASALWRGHLRHNPLNPAWANRDRFVLSNGHGSMLLYALLHLTGYDLPMSELMQFRQLHSKTPGHPEHGLTPGVETTTGPLGQGLANAVGMALAEKILAEEFNRPGLDIVNHRTWAFLGDGCLMEGISHEVCSLAGTWGLSKLICFYDDNGISIDGEVKGWFTDDTAARFRAYGWHVIAKVGGHNTAAVDAAIIDALKQTTRPTLICCQTVIGMGSPNKAGTHDAHGAVLGAKEVAATREKLGWNYPPFVVPEPVRRAWDAREKGKKVEDEWRALFARYQKNYPELAEKFTRQEKGALPAIWGAHVKKVLREVNDKGESIASRKANQNCLEAYGPLLPELVGGSADLTGSNLTKWSGSTTLAASGGLSNNSPQNKAGNYIHYGVREFGMCAIGNGLALHGGLIPYSGTFLMFSDYARNALRMAALMGVRQIFVFTHDSIGLGEDGPTHQPIEQMASLRLIPNMDVWRPCDSYETAVAWAAALERNGGPTSLCLSRQNLPFCSREAQTQAEVVRGGYVLRDSKNPKAVIIATGSEVDVALKAQALLQKEEVEVRVVSIPSTSVFERQSVDYQKKVLPDNLPRVSVEAGVTSGWRAYVGLHGATVGIDRFGESAPAVDLYKFFALTEDVVAKAVLSVLK